MTKCNIGKITPTRGVKKLVIGSNQTWKLKQINLVLSQPYKLMIVIRVQAQDNNTNGYLIYLLKVVSRLKYFIKNSQVVSRSTYKWYPTHGSHDNSKCSKNSFYWQINHMRGITSHTWYQPYKKVVPQVILNFKWSSNEECFPHLDELKIITWMTHAWT